MSEELKRKLFNYEVNPPESAWDRIADSLEEELKAEFPRKLYEAEATPPADSWTKIASAITTDEAPEYITRLYNLEVEPPVGAWQNISGALGDDSLPRIPRRRKIIPIIRYAAAASFVAVVAFGAFKLLHQKTTDGIAGKTVVPPNASPITVHPESQQNPPAQSEPAPSNNLPKERTILAKVNATTRKKSSSNQPPKSGYMTQTPDLVSATTDETTANFQQASLRGEVPGNCPLIADADRYLNFMNPDGSPIRVSKKLADAVGCFYSNGTSDEYKQCQEQIKRWRDKITQSTPASSADHFMDILDILKSVQDNEL